MRWRTCLQLKQRYASIVPPTAEADHLRIAHDIQLAIIRAMTPAERLERALQMNHMMRRLLAAGFRTRHPEWTEHEVKRAVAERILYASTG
jgi:hypothetical protein